MINTTYKSIAAITTNQLPKNTITKTWHNSAHYSRTGKQVDEIMWPKPEQVNCWVAREKGYVNTSSIDDAI